MGLTVHKRARGLKSISVKRRLANKTAKELKRHLETCDARNKDKVTKRFFTILNSLGLPFGLVEAKQIFELVPSLRPTVLTFLSRLPFTVSVADTFLECLDNTKVYDDTTRFGLIEALVKWQVPGNKEGKSFVGKVLKRIQCHDSPFEEL
jgi:hypothetical protein